jgi:hypothetical protein
VDQVGIIQDIHIISMDKLEILEMLHKIQILLTHYKHKLLKLFYPLQVIKHIHNLWTFIKVTLKHQNQVDTYLKHLLIKNLHYLSVKVMVLHKFH